MATLEGRFAVVTGASKGIGAGIAAALAGAGAGVVVNYLRDGEAAQIVVNRIVAAGGRALMAQADVTREDDVARLFATARGAFGPVDILVNNAGVYGFGPFETISPAEFHRQMDVNVLGALLTMREFAAQPEADGGAIVNIVSAAMSANRPYTALYAASKSALASITAVAAKELAPRGIRVNAVAPTSSDTEGTRAMGFVGSAFAAEVAAQIPLGRLGRPEDVAPAVVFLASDDAHWITGETLYASGGDR